MHIISRNSYLSDLSWIGWSTSTSSSILVRDTQLGAVPWNNCSWFWTYLLAYPSLLERLQSGRQATNRWRNTFGHSWRRSGIILLFNDICSLESSLSITMHPHRSTKTETIQVFVNTSVFSHKNKNKTNETFSPRYSEVFSRDKARFLSSLSRACHRASPDKGEEPDMYVRSCVRTCFAVWVTHVSRPRFSILHNSKKTKWPKQGRKYIQINQTK